MAMGGRDLASIEIISTPLFSYELGKMAEMEARDNTLAGFGRRVSDERTTGRQSALACRDSVWCGFGVGLYH